MRAVRLLRVPFLAAIPLLLPHSRFVLGWGASAGLGRLPQSPVSGLAKRAHAPAWGVPPLPPLGKGYPLPPSPACCAQGLHAAWGVPPLSLLVRGSSPLHLLHAVHGERMLIRGGSPLRPFGQCSPPLPLLYDMHWYHTLLRGCPSVALLVRAPHPYLSCMPCAWCAHCCLPPPPLLHPLAAR